MAKTLQQIVDLARGRSDTGDSNAPPDPTVYGFVNQALSDLARIMREVNDSIGLTYVDLTIASGNTMPLPSDFYALKGIDRDPGNTPPITVHPFNFAERNRVGILQYMLKDGDRTVYVLPAAKAPGPYRLWYVTTPPELDVNNPTTATLDATVSPFDGYLIARTAIFILDAIQDPETGRLDDDLATQEAIVRDAVSRRDSELKQAPDVRPRDTGYSAIDPFYWSSAW